MLYIYNKYIVYIDPLIYSRDRQRRSWSADVLQSLEKNPEKNLTCL